MTTSRWLSAGRPYPLDRAAAIVKVCVVARGTQTPETWPAVPHLSSWVAFFFYCVIATGPLNQAYKCKYHDRDLVDKEGLRPGLGKVSGFPVADGMKSNPGRVRCVFTVLPEAVWRQHTSRLLKPSCSECSLRKTEQFKSILNRQTAWQVIPPSALTFQSAALDRFIHPCRSCRLI